MIPSDPTVVLIFGGPSQEHDVSLCSAQSLARVLAESFSQVFLLGSTRSGQWKWIEMWDLEKTSFQSPLDLDQLGQEAHFVQKEEGVFLTSSQGESSRLDVAFPIMHGTFGEDGGLQEILEKLPLPYVGSSSWSCNTCFDKAQTKKALFPLSVPQVPYMVWERSSPPSYLDVVGQLGSSFFIKPARMGSSVGIHRVDQEGEYLDAFSKALSCDSKVVLEKGVLGRELECALLQKDSRVDVTQICEVVTNHSFYSYEAKYLDPHGAQFILPALLPKGVEEKIQHMAQEVFKHLGCRHYARVDFFLVGEDEIYFNEINTHPGFTSISQFPRLWEHQGMGYKELVIHLVHEALKNAVHSV